MPEASRLIERIVPSEMDLSDPDQKNLIEASIRQYRFASLFVKGKRIIDIGCGAGFGTVLLRSEGGASSVLGLDIDEELIRLAGDNYAGDGVEFVCGRYEDLNANAQFDAVVSINTIKHLPDPKDFVNKAAELLVPGSELILSAYMTPTKDFNPYHLTDFTPGSFRRLLKRGGFRVVGEYLQIKRFVPGKSLRLMKTKKSDDDAGGPRSLAVYYLKHPFKAIKRVKSLLKDGFCTKNLVLRAKLPEPDDVG